MSHPGSVRLPHRWPPSAVDLAALLVVFGILAGVLESLAQVLRYLTGPYRLRLGVYLAWMPAAGNLLFFLALGLVLYLLVRLFPRVVTPGRVTGLCAGLAVLAPLRVFDGWLGVITVDLLAVGIGMRCGYVLGPRWDRLRRMVRLGAPVLATALVVTAGGIELRFRQQERMALSAQPGADPARPNVLLLVLDTVRALNLSLYGYIRPTTPFLDSLARHAVTFDRAVPTAPWTLPSHASMFTGRWQHELSADHDVPLDGSYPTLAGELTRRGYRTAGFAANLAFTARASGLDRGFSHYEGHMLSLPQILVSAALPSWIYTRPFLRRHLPPVRSDYHRKIAAEVNREFLRWVGERGDRPFFAFLNYMDAHVRYLPVAPFDTLFGTAAYPETPPLRAEDPLADPVQDMRPYDQAIAYIDYQIGQLLAELERRGLLANTIVIVTADHGEAFGEHGFYGHGSTLYRPMVAVPLVVALPDGVAGGTRVGAPVSLRDLPATVMDLALPGVSHPFPGPSLARAWNGTGLGGDTLLLGVRYVRNNPVWYPTSKGDLNGALLERWLYVREADGTEQLFDNVADPGQRQNLADEVTYTDVLGTLRSYVEREVGPPAPYLADRNRAPSSPLARRSP